MLKHASIVPLIGGSTIGSSNTFGSPPEYFLSYSPFQNNDKHIVNYYNKEIPYYLLDKGESFPYEIDVVSTICPCAGLSTLSHGYGDDNDNNKWMIETSKFVLSEMKPKVFWGENAPGFAGKIGDTVRNEIRKIGKDNGYTMSVYRTKTLLHGGPQVRERSFYFFWKGNKVPLLNYYNVPHAKIEDVISGVTSNFQMEPINKKIPSKDDPYYKFILEHIHGGITHREFFDVIEPQNARNSNLLSYIERKGYDYLQVGEWMEKNDYPKEVVKCKYRHEKLKVGGNIMRRGTMIPKDYIGAFVGHYPFGLTHPYEDRYITYREAMTIMGLPADFELVDASVNNVNHICQNVPVKTAEDMAKEVLAFLNDEREVIEAEYILQLNQSQTYEVEGEKTPTIFDFIS